MQDSLRIIWKRICFPFYCNSRTTLPVTEFSILGLVRIEVSIAPANIDIGSVFFYRSNTTVAGVCVPIVLTCGHYPMPHIIYEQRVAHIRGSHVWHFRTRTFIAIWICIVPNTVNLLRLIEVSFISHFSCLRDRFVIRHYYSYREFRLLHTIISFAILRRKWIERKERKSLWSRTTMAFNTNGILFVFNVLRLHSDSGRQEKYCCIYRPT